MATPEWLCVVVVVGFICFFVGLVVNVHDAEKADKQITEEQVARIRRSVVVKLRELARRVEDPKDDLSV